MERPNPAHRNAQTYQEACEWFVEFRSSEPDDAARRAFHAWLQESPAHLGAYLDVSVNWSQGAAIDVGARWSKDQLIEDARRDTESVVAITPPAHDRRGRQPRRDLRAIRRVRLVCAASALLVTAVLAIYLLALRGVCATALGEQRSLALSDGSTVQLNSLSRIRVRYSEHERRVDLVQGQALFHIAKDAARPFIVYSDRTRVRAVGTEFDVYRKDTGTTVTVLEGRVAVLGISSQTHSSRGESKPPNTDITNLAPGATGVMPSAHAIVLGAGEQITVTPTAARMTLQPNLAGATAWTERRLVFEATPLSNVAEEFNRYNERQLEIKDASLLDFQIDGIFSSTDPASLIRFLRERPEMQVIETEKDIVVTRRGARNSE